jgi:hypothetical protein
MREISLHLGFLLGRIELCFKKNPEDDIKDNWRGVVDCTILALAQNDLGLSEIGNNGRRGVYCSCDYQL